MSSKLLLPSILLLWASACLAQMENPKPIGRGGPHYPMHMLSESKPVAGTLVSCDSTMTVKYGDQYEVRNTPASCDYVFEVESGVPVTIKCPTFMPQCNEYNYVALRFGTDNNFQTYCQPQKGTIDVSVPAKSSGHTIIFYYYVSSVDKISRDMICTVTGSSSDSGDDGDGGGGGGGDDDGGDDDGGGGGKGGGGDEGSDDDDGGGGKGGETTQTDCGESIVQPTGRIIEGGYAALGEYPWMVYITSDTSACGATIIDNQWLLTAAHCLIDLNTGEQVVQITACVGTNDMLNCKKKIKSTKIIAHSSYIFKNKTVTPHDIALAKLAEPLVFDDKIRKVCLPASASDKPAIRSNIDIAGWGLVNKDSSSQFLKKAWLKVIGTNHCGKSKDKDFKLVCMITGSLYPSGRACLGDSGGYGGARNSQGRAVQYGVASFVKYKKDIGCLDPNGYTDVAYYVDWIKEQMANN